jgi:hypothetical protein
MPSRGIARFQPSNPGAPPLMEKEYLDRAKAIREGILQLRDSL